MAYFKKQRLEFQRAVENGSGMICDLAGVVADYLWCSTFTWNPEKKGDKVTLDGANASSTSWETVCTTEIIQRDDMDTVLSFVITSPMKRSTSSPYLHFGGFSEKYKTFSNSFVGNQEGGFSWGNDFFVYCNARACKLPKGENGGFQSQDLLSVIFSPRTQQMHWFVNSQYKASADNIPFPLQPCVTLDGGITISLVPAKLDFSVPPKLNKWKC